jgi:hypothetical protein
MKTGTLNIIHAVRDYRRWIISNNFCKPIAEFDWFTATERYYQTLLPAIENEMKCNRKDFERIFQIPQSDIDKWDQMEPKELENEKWK